MLCASSHCVKLEWKENVVNWYLSVWLLLSGPSLLICDRAACAMNCPRSNSSYYLLFSWCEMYASVLHHMFDLFVRIAPSSKPQKYRKNWNYRNRTKPRTITEHNRIHPNFGKRVRSQSKLIQCETEPSVAPVSLGGCDSALLLHERTILVLFTHYHLDCVHSFSLHAVFGVARKL